MIVVSQSTAAPAWCNKPSPNGDTESTVNFHVDGDVLVVHEIAKRFVLHPMRQGALLRLLDKRQLAAAAETAGIATPESLSA